MGDIEKYGDPSDDKQICQRTWEGKNLDGGDWKTFQIFYDSSNISWENKPEEKRFKLQNRLEDFAICGLN